MASMERREPVRAFDDWIMSFVNTVIFSVVHLVTFYKMLNYNFNKKNITLTLWRKSRRW